MRHLWWLRWDLTRRIVMALHVLRGRPLAYRLLARPTLVIGGAHPMVIECEIRGDA